MSEIYITLITYFTILLILTWGYRKSLAWGKSLPGKAGGGGGGGGAGGGGGGWGGGRRKL